MVSIVLYKTRNELESVARNRSVDPSFSPFKVVGLLRGTQENPTIRRSDCIHPTLRRAKLDELHLLILP